MFATEYYCLVAGLKEYSLDADTKGFEAKAIVGEILDGVSASDAAQVRLLYGYYDCENIASLRAGRSAHNPLGNFTREELEEEVKAPKRLPAAVGRVLRAYADPEGEDAEEVDTAQRFETALFDAYAAALAELDDAKDALAAAQAEYDKYHPKAEPQAKPQVTQAAAKAPVAKKQAAPAALAQTGDNSALAGEVFVIGGITLVAAGVTLSDRRRKQM